MKSIAALLSFLYYFYHGIQRNKTCNFVHGEAFEVGYSMKCTDFRRGA